MLVRRERGESLDDDRERTRRLTDRVRETGESGLRVWTPPPHVSFGRRDASEPGFDRAREIAREMGYPTAVRRTGGRTVAFTEGTLAVALVTPVDDERAGIEDRYERALDALQGALAECGVDADRGEPPNSFCPGSHSLQVDGRKVVGLSQRVRQDLVTLSSIVIVQGETVVADVLEPIYGTLGVTFERETVGSFGSVGGVDRPEPVGDAIVEAVR